MEIFIYLKSRILQFGKKHYTFCTETTTTTTAATAIIIIIIIIKIMVWFSPHNFFLEFCLLTQSIQEE